MSPSGPPTRLVTTESGSDTLKKKRNTLSKCGIAKTSQATLNSRCQKTTALGISEPPDTIRCKTPVASKRGDRWFTKPLSPSTWFQKPWLKCQYGPQKKSAGCLHVCYNVCTSVSRFGTLCRESPCLSVRHKQQCIAAHGGCRLGLLQHVWEKGVVWAIAALSHSQAKTAWAPNHSYTCSAWRSQVPQSTSLANMHRSDAATLRLAPTTRRKRDGSTRATNAQRKQGVPQFLLH